MTIESLFALTPTLGVSFAVSAVLCWILVKNAGLVLNSAHMENDTQAHQALHTAPTPRIGGVAVVAGLSIAIAAGAPNITPEIGYVLFAGLLVFFIGLKEDIWRDVSPRARLITAFVSAAVAILLTGVQVPRLGVPHIDWTFAFVAVPIAVTLIWSAGTCHALNLIDGLNGLSSSFTILALAAMAAIAFQTGQSDVLFVAVASIGALIGFFVFNWPLGRIFLGDAGAYGIGHILAWLGILLIARDDRVAPFAILLILFWPVADTLYSIIRRRVMRRAVGAPDRMHFHHIVIRILRRALRERVQPEHLNPLATAVIIPLFAAPAVAGVLLWYQPIAALFALLLFSLLYVMTYALLVETLSVRRMRRLETFAPRLGPRNNARLEDVSPLSGIYVEDARAVNVRISRNEDGSGWVMVTQAADAGGMEWDRAFDTDRDAWDEFMETVQQQGIEAAVGVPKLRPATSAIAS